MPTPYSLIYGKNKVISFLAYDIYLQSFVRVIINSTLAKNKQLESVHSKNCVKSVDPISTFAVSLNIFLTILSMSLFMFLSCHLECTDSDAFASQCPTLASYPGYCTHNADWTKKYCAKSCGWCCKYLYGLF